MIDLNDRTAVMVEIYGEVCTKTVAAKALGRTATSITHMLDDGRLDAACEGKMVDVRSNARYICQPAKEDFEARKRRTMKKHGSDWAV